MHSLLLLLVLTISCGGNAEKTVPYVMGGSHITIKDIQIEEKALIKCVVRFRDGRNSIELEPSVPRDRRSAICRLPSEIDSGSVDLDLAITTLGMSNNEVIHYESFVINPTPIAEVDVKEMWNSNELSFTWDPDYFRQFYKPGANIMVQATVHISETNKKVYTVSGITLIAGANEGMARISITDAHKAKISNISHPYYYVLRPVGTHTNVFMSSGLFR